MHCVYAQVMPTFHLVNYIATNGAEMMRDCCGPLTHSFEGQTKSLILGVRSRRHSFHSFQISYSFWNGTINFNPHSTPCRLHALHVCAISMWGCSQISQTQEHINASRHVTHLKHIWTYNIESILQQQLRTVHCTIWTQSKAKQNKTKMNNRYFSMATIYRFQFTYIIICCSTLCRLRADNYIPNKNKYNICVRWLALIFTECIDRHM